MKQKIYYFLTLILFFTSVAVFAQDNSHDSRREKYRTEKVAFLTTRLNLTPAEAEKFWCVYNELDNKRWDMQKSRRDLEMKVRDAKESLSGNEIIKLTRDYAASLKQEGDLNVEYNEKFLKILPPQKVLALYKAEGEFRMHMIQMYRNRDGNGDRNKTDNNKDK